MPDESEINELLVSYLLKELDSDKERHVAEMIKKDKVMQQQCAELETLLRIIAIEKNVDEIDIGEERSIFEKKIEPGLRASPQTESFPKETDDLQSEVTSSSKKKKLLTAAAVIFLIAIGGYFFTTSTRKHSKLDGNTVATNSITNKMRHESNFSGRKKTIALADGSVVTLFDQSEIDFPETFTKDKRDIQLTGQAYFKVAKDKTRPFTVYSSGIATTALGTRFTVSNYQHQKRTRVHLFEGKVVVRLADSSLGKSAALHYLAPGQELVYDKIQGTVTIKSMGQNKLARQGNTGAIKYYDNPSIPSDIDGSWFMFNDRPLPEVFDQLGQMYGVSIKYSKTEVQKLYFIGKFDKSDSLDYILRNITMINRLTLLKKPEGYVIKK